MRRAIAGIVAPLLALAVLSVPTAANADEASELRYDRADAFWLMRYGGPGAVRAAKAALVGSDEDVRQLIATGQDALRGTDLRVQVLRLLTTGGPAVRASASTAMDGSDDDREEFLRSGWDRAWVQDERARALQVKALGGYAVQTAAKTALDAGDDAIAEFLATGQFKALEQDQRAEALTIMGRGGQATREMAKAALDGGPETIREFLATGAEVGRARDETLASVAELAEQATAAGKVAAAETDAAVEAAAQAIAAAERAKAAAQLAAKETEAAKDSATKAAAAAGRAADAASQAADAAQVAIGAASQAHSAARAAAGAAARAATLAVKAGNAATHANNEASAAALDKNKAGDARIAAADALKIVQAAKTAAAAAETAAKAGRESGKAAMAAASASGHADEAGKAADEAGGYSQAAGAQAERAKRNAAVARKAAATATRAAKAAVALADKAADAAEEAGRQARKAAGHAEAAAAAAIKAADEADKAHDKAVESKKHADAALVAATASTTAAKQAATVQQVAADAETGRLRLLTDQGVEVAEDALRADKEFAAQAAWDAEESAHRSTETNNLLVTAAAPGASRDVVLSNGRQAAMRLVGAAGPYTRTAAQDALTGGEEEMRYFLTDGFTTATEQDDRTRVAYIAETGKSAALKGAAEKALDGNIAGVREFLKSRSYPGKANDDRAAILALMNAGGQATHDAGEVALNGTDAERNEFLARGQYSAAVHDERLEILTILSATPAPGPEVRSAAKIALAGPQSFMRGFLRAGRAQAQERDFLAATHEGRVAAAVAQAAGAAATAQANAYKAAEAAARAGTADADAQKYKEQAAASAKLAGTYADQADKSAKQAKQSATEAAASAATARKAAAAARADSRKADKSAADARWSAVVAKGHADDARTSADDARASAVAAGKSAADAQKDYDTAFDIALQKIDEEEEARRNNPDPDGDKKCNRPPGYGADASCYPSLPGIDRQDDYGDILCYSWREGQKQCGYTIVTPEQRKIYEQQRDAQNMANACALLIPGCFNALQAIMLADPDAQQDPDVLDALLRQRLGGKVSQLTRQNRLLGKLKCNTTPGKNSFDADTEVVMAGGVTKAISDITVRDRVQATDPVSKVTGFYDVLQLHSNQDTELTDVDIRDDQGIVSTINTTQEHPFWNAGRSAWVDAKDLVPGDRVRTPANAEVTVAVARSFIGSQAMYNLTVAGLHTFYVVAGNAAVLVHNAPCKVKLTKDQQIDLAKFVGYKRVPGNHGKSEVYEIKKPRGGPRYISRDLDQHNGGVFKGADKIEDLWKKETRSGTYDIDIVDGVVRGLVKIGD
jgi:hypothetical protein